MTTNQSNPLIRMMTWSTFVYCDLVLNYMPALSIVALTKDLSLLRIKSQFNREFDNDNS